MNQGTKQRIVGTVVLLALALIFLPIIFDGEGSYQAPLSSRIPEPPVITLLPEPETVRPVIAIGNDAVTVIADTSLNPAPTSIETEAVTDAVSGTAPEANQPVVAVESSLSTTTESTTTEIAANTAEQIVAQQAVGDEIAEVINSGPAAAREIPTLDANGLPQGWSVRLGSFADERNANNLMQRLLASGYRAYTRQTASNGTRMTAVYVGPWLEQDSVRQYQQQLQEEFQLSGLVVRYEVEPIPE